MSAGAETACGNVSGRAPPVPPWPALARPLVLLRLSLGYKSSRCAPCNLSRGYRWAVGELSGDDRWALGALSGGDRCTARAEPPARGLYKGGVGGGVPPHESFVFVATLEIVLCFLCFCLSCLRAFLLSACAFLPGCRRGGFLFCLHPYSRAHLLWTLSPPSWC